MDPKINRSYFLAIAVGSHDSTHLFATSISIELRDEASPWACLAMAAARPCCASTASTTGSPIFYARPPHQGIATSTSTPAPRPFPSDGGGGAARPKPRARRPCPARCFPDLRRCDVASHPRDIIFHPIGGSSSSTAALLWWQHNSGVVARQAAPTPWLGMDPWWLPPYGGGSRTEGLQQRHIATHVTMRMVSSLLRCNASHLTRMPPMVATMLVQSEHPRQRRCPSSPDDRRHAPPPSLRRALLQSSQNLWRAPPRNRWQRQRPPRSAATPT